MKRSITVIITITAMMLAATHTGAVESATITARGKAWTLQNQVLRAVVAFSGGSLSLTSFVNREAKTDYLEGRSPTPLFSFVVNGQRITANDGGWTLDAASVSNIDLYGVNWGRRLEVVLSRTRPSGFFTVRQIFEIYNGRAGMRCLSFLKNDTNHPLAISASDVLSLNLPDRAHTLYYIQGMLNWKSTSGGLTNGGRNALVRYASGDGWFLIPENNWATSLEPGAKKGQSNEKLLGIFAWSGAENIVRVATNPKAVQLTLFPHEEVEYFSVNLGVFKGDVLDGRVAAAEHLRERYKFHDPSHVLSINDWQWGQAQGRRTYANYRNIVIPRAKAAGFDRINIDDFWYAPQDGTEPKDGWTDMPALSDLILSNGMKPGFWFSLQGKYCVNGWGKGRDCAKPANVDFKLRQMENILIGKYHAAWDQVDAGLLWKTGTNTPYSHPDDSVYRKILGMRRYMNTITHKYPDFIMQTTCEVDNPAGPQNIGLIELADDGIAGMFRRTKDGDDVRDLFDDVGMFPLEGMLSTFGENGNMQAAWKDSPLWYYQFLLARHTSIYSWPGNWSAESIAHMRLFNDWRKNPRIKSVLNELMRPVYNGRDWMKNKGPWAWMFINEPRTKAILIAINHLALTTNNAFSAKLRWLSPAKTYLIEEITQIPDGKFNYVYRGEYTGRQLAIAGLPIDLDNGPEPCAAFWIQAKTARGPQVLYADAAVLHCSEKVTGSKMTVEIEGVPDSSACLFVFKPAVHGVERRQVQLDVTGKAKVQFDASTITEAAQPVTFGPYTHRNLRVRRALTKGHKILQTHRVHHGQR